MPDFTDLISQAKQMQEKMKETQEMLKKIEVEGISGGNSVKVIMNGDGELKKITLDEASLKECLEQSKKNSWHIVQDVAWENYELVPKLTMAGYSVMVKEITSQTDQYITHVFLQAGVGGMAAGTIAGIAKYFKKIPKIIIVEPETADCVLRSVENGALKKIEIKKESIMGGMSCGEVSLIPWKIIKNSVNMCLSISDDNIAKTVAMLANFNFSDEK